MRKKLIIHSSLFSPFLQITIPIPFPIPNNPNQVITKFPVRKYLNEYKTKTWKFFRFGKEFDAKSNYYLPLRTIILSYLKHLMYKCHISLKTELPKTWNFPWLCGGNPGDQ